jgi:quercetin dioxygenase-like cupin family protein
VREIRPVDGSQQLILGLVRPKIEPMQKETIRVGQVGIRFLLEAADTNGLVAMFEFTVPVGSKVPIPHYHKSYDETIYGVEGVVTFTVEGKPVDIGPGETCFIPRGTVHGFNKAN